jgi:[ribosomal protein S5]-alanine N-acetyltransferase
MTAGHSESLAGVLAGTDVLLRHITSADEAEFIKLARASVDAHHPWMELPVTPEEFAVFVARYEPPVVNIGLAVCEQGSGVITGGINLNTIVRGRFQSASLGYWAFTPTSARGYMSQAIKLVLRYAFGDLGLHRLEANIQPGNHASIRLVERNGFRDEGFSPDYLFIDGAWRGHQRWAITREMVGW